jgi:hypothetical protein
MNICRTYNLSDNSRVGKHLMKTAGDLVGGGDSGKYRSRERGVPPNGLWHAEGGNKSL